MLVVYDLYSAFPHTRPLAFIPVICFPEWRSLQSLISSLADSGGDRQTPRYRSVSVDGRCGDLTQSEARAHAHRWKHVSPFYTDAGCPQSYTSCRWISAAASGDSCSSVLYIHSIRMWITGGIPGLNVSWFIVSFNLGERCSWFAPFGHYNNGKLKKQKQN